MQLSIVSTLYRSAPYIDEFLQRTSTSVQQISEDYELILVNDGSPDDSLSKALCAQQQNARIKIIDLSRNFGHHEAGMVGLQAAQGDYVFLIDSDLEEAPELIVSFWQDLQADTSLDAIYGVQEERQGGWQAKMRGQGFYRLFNFLSDVKISPNLMTVRLMKKPLVAAIVQYQERNLFVAGIMAHAGFKQQAKTVVKQVKQESAYTLTRQLKLLINSLTSFSTKPLLYLLLMGWIMFVLALITSVYVGVQVLIFGQSVSWAASLSLATLFIMATVMGCSGLLGLYLATIATEIKQRPRAIIKTIYSKFEHSS